MRKYISTRVRKIWAAVALLSIELLVVLLLFILSLFGFAFLVNRVFRVKETKFDQKAFDLVGQFVNEGNTAFMKGITFLGTHLFLIPANLALIGYFLFIKKHRWYSIKVPVVAIGSVTLMLLLKLFFSRIRPSSPLLAEVKGFSFPSGHAMSSMTFYGLLIFLAFKYVPRPMWKFVLIFALSTLIFIIGLSRIYLRVHYATDVLAGFAMGIIWLVISLWATRRIEKMVQKNRTVKEVVEVPPDIAH